jgi:hypothetical protein
MFSSVFPYGQCLNAAGAMCYRLIISWLLFKKLSVSAESSQKISHSMSKFISALMDVPGNPNPFIATNNDGPVTLLFDSTKLF